MAINTDKPFFLILLSALFTTIFYTDVLYAELVVGEDDKEIFEQEILKEKLAEAKRISEQVKMARGSKKTTIVIDFSYFSDNEKDAQGLVKALDEFSNVHVRQLGKNNGWKIRVSTRPKKIDLDWAVFGKWIEKMVKLGFRYNSVFLGFSGTG